MAFLIVARIRTALIVVGTLGLCGCAVVGPQAISGGRGVYAEVINVTEDEQILNAMVHMRYDQSFGMMSVASVTASLRFSARAGGNFGVGPSDAYAGNLVPISVGVAYEENPTISYKPLSGEDFQRRMLAPLSEEDLILLLAAVVHPGRVLSLAVSRVNGLRNPLLTGEPPQRDFARFIELYTGLREDGIMDYVEDPEPESEGESKSRPRYFWEFHDYADAHGDDVREFLDLLGIEKKADGSPIVLPVLQAVGSSTSAIHLNIRSAYRILKLLGDGIELPPSHVAAGVVEPAPESWPGGEPFLRVHSVETSWWDSRPEDASVAIRFRDRWFYIADSDVESKRAFLFLRTMIGMRLADPGADNQAPLLTVPVN